MWIIVALRTVGIKNTLGSLAVIMSFGLDPYRCDGRQCPGLVWNRTPKKGQQLPHRWHKGGGIGRVIRETAYHIPESVVEYVSGLAPGPPPWMDRTEESVDRIRGDSATSVQKIVFVHLVFSQVRNSIT